MTEYFSLQFRRINRRFTDFGFNVVVCYALLIAAFVLLSLYLFTKTEFAQYIYVFIALSVMGNMSDSKRNDFLKSTFKNGDWRKIRLLENGLVALPFVSFLMYQQCFESAIGIFVLSLLLSTTDYKISSGRAIPTPFSKKPFEFSVGFRNTILLFPLAYGIVVAAVWLNNFNLGVFSLLSVFAITMSFYSKPENEFYVWSHTLSAKQFLWQKVKVSLIYAVVLCLPVLATMAIFFSDQLHYLMLATLAGLAFQACMVLIKYSAYPGEINVSQGVIVALCIYFPPLIAAAIPFFYYQAIQRLNAYLR